jgi:CheY-specific phosphatase CheX
VLPGHLRRIAHVDVRLQPDKDGGGSGPVKACLTMRGHPGAKITLATELELALKIACGMLGFATDEMDDDLIEDGLAEFLNVVSGRVAGLLRSEGIDLQIEPPEPGLADLSGVPFRIESLRGNGTLYIHSTND